MGDPRRLRKKYEVPHILWETSRISEERQLKGEYGLKNVREIWVAKSELRKIRRQVRGLSAVGEKGKDMINSLINRVVKMSYCQTGATLDDLLSLDVRAILNRRLQTLVFKQGLAKSVKQARQLITHGFIAVDGKKVSSPSYLVPTNLEGSIGYYKTIEIGGEEKRAHEEKLKEIVEDMKPISEGAEETVKTEE
jgi:small subunit ribosomal protein S4